MKHLWLCVLLMAGFACGESEPDITAPDWTAGARLTMNPAETSVRVSWPPAFDDEGVTIYRVFVDGGLVAELPSDVFEFMVESLKPAQRYQVSVSAQDGAGNESISPLESEVVTLDLTPPAWTGNQVRVEELTATSARLEWNAGEDNSGGLSYSVYLNDRLRARVEHPVTAAVVDMLTPTTIYATRIEAIDARGNRAVSALSTNFTTPDEVAPTWVNGAQLSLVSADDDSVTLAWEPAVDDVAVERYEISDQNGMVLSVSGDELSIEIVNLEPDTAYTFTLTAIDGSGNRSMPLQREVRTTDVTPPTWPEDAAIDAIAVSDDTITLEWSPAADLTAVSHYTILKDLVELDTVIAPMIRHQVIGLSPDTEYVFDVFAYDRVGNRSFEAQRIVIRTTDSQVPTWPVDAVLSVMNIEETSAQIRWIPAVDNVGVVGYRVDVEGVTTHMVDANQTYVDLTTLLPATVHRVAVFANDRVGGWSAPLETTLKTLDETRPTWPAGSSLELNVLSETELEVQWPPAADEQGIQAYLVSVNGSERTRVDSSQQMVRVSNLTAWTSYTVRVDAEDAGGNRTESGLQGIARTRDDTAPTLDEMLPLSAEQLTATSVWLRWGAATDNVDVTGYELLQDGVLIHDADTLQQFLSVSELSPGQTYSFELVAVDPAGNRSIPQMLTITTPDGGVPTWPAGSNLTLLERTEEAIIITWTAAQDDVAVTAYQVFHQNVLLERVLAPVRTVRIENLPTTDLHVFRVEAEDATGGVSFDGPELSLDLSDTTPPTFGADDLLEVGQIGARSAVLTWSPANDDTAVVSYRIQIDGAEAQTVNGDVLSLSLDGLQPLTEYTVSVVAEDGAGQQTEPLSVVFTTVDLLEPTWRESDGVSISELGPDRVNLSWDTPSGAVAFYRVFIEPSATGEVLEVEQVSISLGALSPETAYRVEVLAIGPTGKLASNPLELVFETPADMPPDWPIGSSLAVSDVYETGMTVSWEGIDHALEVVEYIISVNESEVAVVDSAQRAHTIRNLVLGQMYTVSVIAENVRGLRSTVGLSTMAQTMDVTPPQFPPDGQLETEAPTVTTIGVSWSAGFDNVELSGYRLYRNDVFIAELDASVRTYRSTGMQPGTPYNFTVNAVDATGTESVVGLAGVGMTRSDENVPSDEAMRVALASDCAGCHNSWFLTAETFDNHVVHGRSGDFANSGESLERDFITPGDPDASLLIEFMEARAPDVYGYIMMPPTGFGVANADFATLSEAGETEVTLLQVRDWIELMGVEP